MHQREAGSSSALLPANLPQAVLPCGHPYPEQVFDLCPLLAFLSTLLAFLFHHLTDSPEQSRCNNVKDTAHSAI